MEGGKMEGLNNLPPFYVGQKVVCVRSCDSTKWGTGDKVNGVVKGETYTIKAIAPNCCGVGFMVDVGLIPKYDVLCSKCCKNLGKTLWANPKLFAPIEKQNFPLMTFKEIVKKEEEQVLIDN